MKTQWLRFNSRSCGWMSDVYMVHNVDFGWLITTSKHNDEISSALVQRTFDSVLLTVMFSIRKAEPTEYEREQFTNFDILQMFSMFYPAYWACAGWIFHVFAFTVSHNMLMQCTDSKLARSTVDLETQNRYEILWIIFRLFAHKIIFTKFNEAVFGRRNTLSKSPVDNVLIRIVLKLWQLFVCIGFEDIQ